MKVDKWVVIYDIINNYLQMEQTYLNYLTHYKHAPTIGTFREGE